MKNNINSILNKKKKFSKQFGKNINENLKKKILLYLEQSCTQGNFFEVTYRSYLDTVDDNTLNTLKAYFDTGLLQNCNLLGVLINKNQYFLLT